MVPLEDLLDRAAEALLAGDLATLGTLTSRIEAGATTLSDRTAPDRATADRLHAKAQRNARLLEAATRGVKSARQRVLEITRGPTLTTYDARGLKAVIAPVDLQAARRV